jgi:hypothetical protein
MPPSPSPSPRARASRWATSGSPSRTTGSGVPVEERDLVFERFARGAVAGRRSSSDGAGLGLALVDEHIRMHGGRVWVEDRLDGEPGARFVLELPAEEVGSDAVHGLLAGADRGRARRAAVDRGCGVSSDDTLRATSTTRSPTDQLGIAAIPSGRHRHCRSSWCQPNASGRSGVATRAGGARRRGRPDVGARGPASRATTAEQDEGTSHRTALRRSNCSRRPHARAASSRIDLSAASSPT